MTAYQRGAIDLDTVQSVQVAMIAHCELMGDRMAILDPPPGLNAQQIKEWRVDKAGYDSKFAALYWPWVSIGGGHSCHRPDSLPESGAATTTPAVCTRRRPTKSCAARIDLETQITRKEHDLLNPVGINCIRAFPGAGNPRLGRAHAVVRPGVAVPEHPPPVQLSWRSRSSRTPTGWSSNRTTRRCGPSCAERSAHSWSTNGARARCSGSHPTKRSSSSATTKPTRPRASTPARWSADRRRAGQTRRVRHLPPVAVLRRNQLGSRVTPTNQQKVGKHHGRYPKTTARSATRSAWNSTASRSRASPR